MEKYKVTFVDCNNKIKWRNSLPKKVQRKFKTKILMSIIWKENSCTHKKEAIICVHVTNEISDH